jgi:hypothetical protein
LADRYPRIADDAAQIKGHAIIDAEVVCLDSKGIAQSWIKVKNPKAPAATRILDGTF